MTTIAPMKESCKTLTDIYIHDPSGSEEYKTTIPTGTEGTILGITSSDNYVVYFGNEYDEATIVYKDHVRIVD